MGAMGVSRGGNEALQRDVHYHDDPLLDDLDLLFDNQRWARDQAHFNLRESRI